MVERLNGIQKVRGSTPLISTKIIAMILNTEINNSVVKDIKNILKDKLDKVFLYGSYVRGDETDESDVDYLILTSLKNEEIKKYNELIIDLSYKYLDKYNILFSFVIINSKHFNAYSEVLPYYNNIVNEGVVIYG